MTAAEGPESTSENERLRRELHKVAETLKATTAAYEEFASRRVVRAASRSADALAPLYRRVRRREEAPAVDPNEPIWRAIAALDQQPGRDTGPLVSVIITTRNHHEMLVELLTAIDQSAYPTLEVIIVDNGSSDDTAELDPTLWRRPITIVHNERNTSFSAANNQGVERASGEFVLLLNDDILPLHGRWLDELIGELETDNEIDAAGAVLTHPVVGNDAHVDSMRLQHFGIGFAWDEGLVRPFNLRDGESILTTDIGGSAIDVDAATAACLLIRRDVIEDMGGFDEDFVYGYEDVDLCLRIPGRIVLSRRSVLLHRESTSQNEWPSDLLRVNRLGNRRVLMNKHGRELQRRAGLELLIADSQWRARPRTVGITVTSADPADGYGDLYTGMELATAMEGLGWKTRLLQAKNHEWAAAAGCDVVVSLLQGWDPRVAPDGTITVAWVRNVPDSWIASGFLDHFDLVLGSSVRLCEYLESACGFRPFLLPLATNPERFQPTEVSPTFECDVVLTANHWGVDRTPVHQLSLRDDEQMMILGRGWESVPAAAGLSRGAVDYSVLPIAYSSARIALDETTVGRLEYGAVNSRVFDALSTGALVLSNNTIGSDECFDGLLPTYDDVDELRSLLDRFLGDSAERSALSSQLRELVLSRHTYEHRAHAIEAALAQLMSQPRIAILVGAPNWDVVSAWGDYHFAAALARSLRRLGAWVDIRIHPEWGELATATYDVVLHLRGITPYVPVPGACNIMWLISHPDLLHASECDRFDLVLVASESEARRLAPLTSTPVHTMLQASAFERPVPADSEAPSHDVLFVGNTRGVERPGVRWACEAGLPIAIYGAGWTGTEAHRVVAPSVDNRSVAELYAAADVVLNDHWPDMAERGFISNRIFDALAAGTVCVTDQVEGLQDVFGDVVPAYGSQDELVELVERLQADPASRAELAEAGRRVVHGAHTFEHRAAEIVRLLPESVRHRLQFEVDANEEEATSIPT